MNRSRVTHRESPSHQCSYRESQVSNWTSNRDPTRKTRIAGRKGEGAAARVGGLTGRSWGRRGRHPYGSAWAAWLLAGFSKGRGGRVVAKGAGWTLRIGMLGEVPRKFGQGRGARLFSSPSRELHAGKTDGLQPIAVCILHGHWPRAKRATAGVYCH